MKNNDDSIETGADTPGGNLNKDTAKAEACFLIWANQGSSRSLQRTADESGLSYTSIKRYHQKYDWPGQLRHFNKELRHERMEALKTEKIANPSYEEWLSKKEHVRAQELFLSEKLIQVGHCILQQYFEGEIQKVTLSDAVRVIELGSRLGRLATGLTNNRNEFQVEQKPLMDELAELFDQVYRKRGEPNPNKPKPQDSSSPCQMDPNLN